MRTNYHRGRDFEYARMRYWKSLGYTVIRSSGSKSPFDLVCISPPGRVSMIQCKRVQTRTQALNLLKKFRANPPLKLMEYRDFTQVMEVYVKDTREVLDGWA